MTSPHFPSILGGVGGAASAPPVAGNTHHLIADVACGERHTIVVTQIQQALYATEPEVGACLFLALLGRPRLIELLRTANTACP